MPTSPCESNDEEENLPIITNNIDSKLPKSTNNINTFKANQNQIRTVVVSSLNESDEIPTNNLFPIILNEKKLSLKNNIAKKNSQITYCLPNEEAKSKQAAQVNIQIKYVDVKDITSTSSLFQKSSNIFKSGQNLDVQTSFQNNNEHSTNKANIINLKQQASFKKINNNFVRVLPGANCTKLSYKPISFRHIVESNPKRFKFTDDDTNKYRTNSKLSTSYNPNQDSVVNEIKIIQISQEESPNDIIQGVSIGTKRKSPELVLTSKKPNCTIMSVYDRHFSTDDRLVVTNGYLSSLRSAPSHNDDGSSNTITSHCYNPSMNQPSIASLCNIGNTCYLNSIVYTLRFAPLFLHNLHHLVEDLTGVQQNVNKNRLKSSSLGRNVSGINMETARSWSNKDLASFENYCDTEKSGQQIATEKLHELYQNLHKNEMMESNEPFHADTFLHAVQQVNSLFEGNQQQDAHEFLMCLLDSIRETSRSLIKTVAECPDIIKNGFLKDNEETSKEDPIQLNGNNARNTSVPSTSNLKKSSFFSRKLKPKDEVKISKNLRLQSPLKETPTPAIGNSHNLYNTSVNLPNSGNVTVSAKNNDDGEDLSNSTSDELTDKIKKRGLDFFSENFEGITVATTKCLSCETITEQKETMVDIAVPVPISGYDDSEYLDKSNSFIQNACITREYFRGENKYRCEQCSGYTEAIRSISYEVLPRLLVIQLSRFSGGMEKINSFIPTPFTLQCFCAKCCELDENNKLHVYKLYSVITHVGVTLSVGHYIAYTCALDWPSEYINCAKDKARQTQQKQTNLKSGSNVSTESSGSEKNFSIVKKMIFGRSKASSSGDMSKTVKNLNSLTASSGNKNITNGLSTNLNCHSFDCCGIRLKKDNHNSNRNNIRGSNNNGSGSTNGTSNLNLVDNIQSNQCNTNNITTPGSGSGSGSGSGTTNNYNNINSNNYSSSYDSNNTARSNEQPLWYMCDDDKIKTMTQREFEDLLSPNQKITVTPYLLFYARSDLQ